MATMAAATGRDLRPLFEPRSVAVVGASNDPAKWGQWLARGALRGEHRRSVHLVNRSGGEVLGRPAYRALEELPEPPELVVLAIPASAFEETVDAALAAGTRAIVAIAAGLGETSEEGAKRERAVVERVRAAGAVLLGPNCMGVYDAAAELDLSSSDFVPGSLGIVSQSGNLALEIALLAGDFGLGVSRFVSLGNQADLAPGVQAARSHTGALVSEAAAIEAACRASGILQVSTPRELADLAQLMLATSRPSGRRVAIVTDGGGSAVVAADLATEAGLELPQLSPALAASLAEVLPDTATTTNPVDFAGAGEQDLRSYERVPRLLLESGEIDALLLTGYLGGYSATSEELREPETEAARGLARAAEEAGRPAIVQTMYWQESPAQALREEGVPVYREIGAAIASIGRVAAQRTPSGVPQLPPPREPWSGSGYLESRELLARGGVVFPEARRVTTAEEGVAAAAGLGYPVVLKALGVLHKSAAGGVALGLEDEGAVTAAMAAMTAPEGYSVEQQEVTAQPSVELIAGCRRDPRFGPILLVGLGGILAEVLRDTAVALAPAEPELIEELLLGLRGAALLTGARGRPALDVRAAAEACAAISRVAAEHPELDELEVNPLLVTPSGAVGLDARVVHSQPR
jgi:acyl-CoA synthetase (NDP forming)